MSVATESALGPARRQPALLRPFAWVAKRHTWTLVIAAYLGVYLLVNLGLTRVPTTVLSGFVRAYVLQPVLWSGMAAGVILAARYGSGGRLTFQWSLMGIALLLGAFQVAVIALAGLLTTFGLSPYAHNPTAVLASFAYWSTTLVATEVTRAYLINVFARRLTALVLVVVGLALAVLDLPLARYLFQTPGIQAVPFVSGTLVPLAGEHLLSSYLAFVGGPVASISYRGIMDAFEWLSPVLPNPPWVILGFLGIMVPMIGYFVAGVLYAPQPAPSAAKPSAQVAPEAAVSGVSAPAQARPKKKGLSLAAIVSWAVIAVASVLIIMFGRGTFSVRPGVVLTGSMSPSINAGDVVLTRTVPIETIEKGDVILYQDGNIGIWHRVIDVKGTETSRSFITKGDANNGPDAQPVLPAQVQGKVVFRVPKLGVVSLAVKGLFDRSPEGSS